MNKLTLTFAAFVFAFAASGVPRVALVPGVRTFEDDKEKGVFTVRPKTAWTDNDWHDFDIVGQCVRESGAVRRADSTLPPEGYSLVVTTNGIEYACRDEAGAFYALQTLRQLAVLKKTNEVAFACCSIRDWPEYRWRGVLIDEARYFLGKDTIKQTLDAMAKHKFNVLHWHLTDDQGWRLDIPGFPELVKYGAVRPKTVRFGTHARWLPPEQNLDFEYDDAKYGPYYYTAAEVAEIVAYAKERHITVIPEIEVPGHVRAFLAAYPEYSCVGPELPRIPRCGWSIETEVLCVGNDQAVERYKAVVDKVCEMFPDSPYIHIGGDECRHQRWKECPKCQARLKAIGGKDENDLQAWITTQVVRHLEGRGRRVIGWDEVLSGDVPRSTIGMTWRTNQKGGAGNVFVSAAQAVRRGHDMVMTPVSHCYLDYPQGLEDDPFPYYQPWAEPTTLAKAHSFNPSEGIPSEYRSHILGGQANMWGECIQNICDLQWKMWPRACAIAEALWLGPSKPAYWDFEMRMRAHRKRLIAENVICAPLK